ncbi:MAG: hypothetical protein IH591_06005, partial [Bacteroidales bacterium]|nr:hypothetical protein [Bacteroidales bacterium]
METNKIRNEKLFMLSNEIFPDSILPFGRNELQRDVRLTGEVKIEGGIFCKNLDIEGSDVFIQKSVYAEDTISVSLPKPGYVWFNSPVGAGHSILRKDNSEGRLRFSHSVDAKILNLNNTIVYGNIMADNIILNNSIVLGGVFCAGTLEISDSIVGTYNSVDVVQKGKLGIMYPLAISKNKPDINENLYILIPDGFSNGMKNIYKITQDDFYTFTGEKGKVHLFSNSMRIFDMHKYSSVLLGNLIKLLENNYSEDGKFEQVRNFLSDFDNDYFNVLERGFKPVGKSLFSEFMKVPEDTIKEFMTNEKGMSDKTLEAVS